MTRFFIVDCGCGFVCSMHTDHLDALTCGEDHVRRMVRQGHVAADHLFVVDELGSIPKREMIEVDGVWVPV